jgi:opacity protein-like surface antigen
LRALAAALALSVGISSVASAAAPDPGDWEFSLAAYGWLTGIDGTLTARDTSVDVDLQFFGDVLQNLDGALMSAFEARYRGRWIANLDFVGSQLSAEIEQGPFRVGFGPRTFTRELGAIERSFAVDTPLGTLEVPIRVDPGTLRVDVPRVETALGPFDVDVKTIMLNSRLQLGYRVADVPALALFGRTPGDDPRRVRVDVFAGLRYWWMKTEIDIESPPIQVPPFTVTSSISGGSVSVGGNRIPPQTVALPRVHLPDVDFQGASFGGTDVDRSATTWWIDPLVGLRVGADLCERLSVVVAGNVGGFGIGSASKFSWEALAFLDWRFSESTSLALGYRGLGLDHGKGNAQADMTLHGPLLGLVLHF